MSVFRKQESRPKVKNLWAGFVGLTQSQCPSTPQVCGPTLQMTRAQNLPNDLNSERIDTIIHTTVIQSYNTVSRYHSINNQRLTLSCSYVPAPPHTDFHSPPLCHRYLPLTAAA